MTTDFKVIPPRNKGVKSKSNIITKYGCGEGVKTGYYPQAWEW